jgi:hypothetical protein
MWAMRFCSCSRIKINNHQKDNRKQAIILNYTVKKKKTELLKNVQNGNIEDIADSV